MSCIESSPPVCGDQFGQVPSSGNNPIGRSSGVCKILVNLDSVPETQITGPIHESVIDTQSLCVNNLAIASCDIETDVKLRHEISTCCPSIYMANESLSVEK